MRTRQPGCDTTMAYSHTAVDGSRDTIPYYRSCCCLVLTIGLVTYAMAQWPTTTRASSAFYAPWPSPRTSLCEMSTRAVNISGQHPVRRVDIDHLLNYAKRRVSDAMKGIGSDSPPPVVVISGRNYSQGLGNVLQDLVGAAVLAHSVGAVCLFSYGDAYVGDLDLGPVPVYPCHLSALHVLTEIRSQTKVPVLRYVRWRDGEARNFSSTEPFVIDFGSQRKDCTRHDLALDQAPPGMAPDEYFRRLRRGFQEVIFGAEDRRLRLPLGAHFPADEELLPGRGAICGHMRMLQKEMVPMSATRPCGPVSDCGPVLFAMNEMSRVHGGFARYLWAAPGKCGPCVPQDAPDLHASAVDIREATGQPAALDPTLLARKERAVKGFHHHGNILGAMEDMRALASSCSIIVHDDFGRSFALAVAAAGGFRPCGSPLAWIEKRRPGYKYNRPEAMSRLLGPARRSERVGLAQQRLLCRTADLGAPPRSKKRCGAPDGPAQQWVNYNVTRPWAPWLVGTSEQWPEPRVADGSSTTETGDEDVS